MNAIYVRVSTEEQAKSGYSLSDQISSCKLHLLRQGYTDAVEYIDDGYSGEFSDRPAFSTLRDDIRAGHIDIVAVYDPDRLARKLAVQLLFAEEVEKANVQLQFVTGDYDASPEGRLFFSMRGAIAEFEKEKIKDRTMRGKRKKSSQGKIMQDFGLYGYDFNPTTSTYMINQEQAKVIQEIFRLVIEEQMSIEKIQKVLQKRIIYSPKGKRLWGVSSLYNIIKNTTYTGTFMSMRVREKKDGIRSKKRSIRPENEWIPIPVPAIIDEVTFKQAHHQLERNKTAPKRTMKYNYLVGGMLYCGVCGRKMLAHYNVFHNGTSKPYYQCSAQRYAHLRNSGVTCTSRSLPADAFDNDIWEKLIEFVYEEDKISNYLPQQHSSLDYKDEFSRITEIATTLIKRRQTIIKWSGQQMISAKEAEEELKQIKMQLTDIEERKISLQLTPVPVTQLSFREMASKLLPLIERGELMSENKKIIIHSVIKKITAIRIDKRPASKNLYPIFEFKWELV